MRGQYNEITDRTFWRQKNRAPVTSRTKIHGESGVEAGAESLSIEWPLEHWSPRGRYVLYMQPSIGRMHLLEMGIGRIRCIGANRLHCGAIAWKPDESAVACINGVAGLEKKCEALLVQSDTLATIDFTTSFTKLFSEVRPGLNAAWTTDGNYLLIRDFFVGGAVVRPDPWLCNPLGEKLPSRFNPETRLRYMSDIYPLPVAGWIRARDPDFKGYILVIRVEVVPNFLQNLFVIGDLYIPDQILAFDVKRNGCAWIVVIDNPV
jgi:hypothetical protein